MSLREFAAWLSALAVVLPVALASSGPSASSEDPWATTRACTTILEHFVECRTDPSFQLVVISWCDSAAIPSLSEKQLRARLKAWRKPDARRLSCAIWSGLPGASEQVGERSPLARLATRAVACHDYNRQLAQSPWLRARAAETP